MRSGGGGGKFSAEPQDVCFQRMVLENPKYLGNNEIKIDWMRIETDNIGYKCVEVDSGEYYAT